MATPGNPVAALMARSIVDSLAAKNRPGSPAPQPSGTQDREMGQQMLGSQLSELRQADPQGVQRSLQQIKKTVVDMIPQVAFSIPGMNKHLPNLLKTVEAAIKEVEQASGALSAVAGPGVPGGSSPMNPLQSSVARPGDGVGVVSQPPGLPFSG